MAKLGISFDDVVSATTGSRLIKKSEVDKFTGKADLQYYSQLVNYSVVTGNPSSSGQMSFTTDGNVVTLKISTNNYLDRDIIEAMTPGNSIRVQKDENNYFVGFVQNETLESVVVYTIIINTIESSGTISSGDSATISVSVPLPQQPLLRIRRPVGGSDANYSLTNLHGSVFEFRSGSSGTITLNNPLSLQNDDVVIINLLEVDQNMPLSIGVPNVEFQDGSTSTQLMANTAYLLWAHANSSVTPIGSSNPLRLDVYPLGAKRNNETLTGIYSTSSELEVVNTFSGEDQLKIVDGLKEIQVSCNSAESQLIVNSGAFLAYAGTGSSDRGNELVRGYITESSQQAVGSDPLNPDYIIVTLKGRFEKGADEELDTLDAITYGAVGDNCEIVFIRNRKISMGIDYQRFKKIDALKEELSIPNTAFVNGGQGNDSNSGRSLNQATQTLSAAMTVVRADPSAQHKEVIVSGYLSHSNFANTATTGNVPNLNVGGNLLEFNSLNLTDHSTNVVCRAVVGGNITLGNGSSVSCSVIGSSNNSSIQFSAEHHISTKVKCRRMREGCSINFSGVSVGSHINIEVDTFDGTTSDINSMVDTIPTGVTVSGWIGATRLP